MKYEQYSEKDFLKDDFFVKWVKGEDPEADFFWEEWMKNHPEKKEVIIASKWIVESIQYKNNHDLTSKEYVDLYENILKSDTDIFTTRKTKSSSSLWFGIAAAFVLLLSFIAVIHRKNLEPAEQVVYTAMSTKKGEKYTFKMEDGTIVKLNAGSTIKYPALFSKTEERIVYLEGEAFFDVATDKKRPFIVKSSLVSTRVTGTKFNVKNDFEDGTELVALLEGEVVLTLAGSNESLVLKPMQMALCSDQGMARADFIPEDLIGWTEKKLVFKNASSDQVKKKLELWYGVDIVMETDKMFENTYTGVFHDEPLENVLLGISYTVGQSFTYHISGSQVTIEKNHQE